MVRAVVSPETHFPTQIEKNKPPPLQQQSTTTTTATAATLLVHRIPHRPCYYYYYPAASSSTSSSPPSAAASSACLPRRRQQHQPVALQQPSYPRHSPVFYNTTTAVPVRPRAPAPQRVARRGIHPRLIQRHNNMNHNNSNMKMDNDKTEHQSWNHRKLEEEVMMMMAKQREFVPATRRRAATLPWPNNAEARPSIIQAAAAATASCTSPSSPSSSSSSASSTSSSPSSPSSPVSSRGNSSTEAEDDNTNPILNEDEGANEHHQQRKKDFDEAQTKMEEEEEIRVEKQQQNKKKKKKMMVCGLGDYYVTSKTLGKGSFSSVKLGFEKRDSTKKVAIKCVSKADLSPEKESELLREIEILRSLRNTSENKENVHTVQLLKVYEDEDYYYLIFDYYATDLYAYLKKRGALSESEARHLFRQLMEAIRLCHCRGICHRDIKLENILLDERTMKIVLADFGFACFAKEDQRLTKWCGSAYNVAPEILTRTPYLGRASDIWASGSVLYALLHGRFPFQAKDMPTIFALTKQGTFHPFLSGLSLEARHLISGMLTVNPKKRFKLEQVINHPWLCGDRKKAIQLLWESARHLPSFFTPSSSSSSSHPEKSRRPAAAVV